MDCDENLKNNLLLEFWTIYDNYGINNALEWLEYNKYYELINKNINGIDDLSHLLNNLKVSK